MQVGISDLYNKERKKVALVSYVGQATEDCNLGRIPIPFVFIECFDKEL